MAPGLHINDSQPIETTAPSKQVAMMMRGFFAAQPSIASNLSLDLIPEEDDRIELHFIHANIRRRGHASMALRCLGILCDRYGVTVTCNATSLAQTLRNNEGCLNQEDLVALYERNGFKVDDRLTGHLSMTRRPRR